MSVANPLAGTRPEIDLNDVLRQRVERGEPIVICHSVGLPRQPRAQQDTLLETLAVETGRQVRCLEIVELAPWLKAPG